MKKVEEENRKLRERVKEHEELFSGLEEEDVQFEEMDEVRSCEERSNETHFKLANVNLDAGGTNSAESARFRGYHEIVRGST